MRERPILFSAPMVRAILAGTKTQTRRVVNPQPSAGVRGSPFAPSGVEDGHGRQIPWRYGEPPDQLWVRETWADLTATHGVRWEKYNHATGLYERGQRPFYWYAADGDQPDSGGGERNPERWRPSIHMPRRASRIQLEITEARIERLHDISAEDIMAEGITTTLREHDAVADLHAQWETLWTKINGAASWNANPWVYAITFKRIQP